MTSLSTKQPLLKRGFLPGLFSVFCLLVMQVSSVSGQTVVWSDNFDAPSGGANNNNAGAGWTLNSGGSGSNQWFINTGSSFGCSTSGNALKISCTGFLCGFLGGPNEPIYQAASSNDRTAVSPNINTTGLSNLTLSFVFQCAGVSNQDYGTVAFSADGGTTWTDLAGRFESVSSCSTYTAAIPSQYWNISNFKMRFRWVESNAAAGNDPPFTVDNIQITTPGSVCTPPTVSAGSNVSICAGGSTSIGGSPTASGGSESGAYVYSWTPATGLSSTTAANPMANPAATTTYTVTVHRGTPSCSASSQVTVTVNTPVALSITAAGSTTICPGQTVGLSGTAGFTGYNWSLPGGGTASTQAITATQVGSYGLTATDANGCTSTASALSVSAGNADVLAVTASGPLSFCSGQSVTLSAAAGYSNYVWSDGATGQTHEITESGTYSVSAEGGSCGAISTDYVVTVAPAQTLNVTPSGSITLCQGETVTLTADAGFSNYTWSNNTTGSELTVTQAGNYNVTATDGNGCSAVSSFVNVSYNPVFTVGVTPSGNVNVCEGESITLTAQSGFSNYTWSNSSQGPTLTVSSAGFYSVSAENGLGCTGSSQVVNVSVIDVGDIDFTWVQTDIPIYTVQFTSGVIANTYLWDFGNGATSTEANPTYTFPFDGNYQVSLTVETDCGDGSISKQVNVIKTGFEFLPGVGAINILPSADGNGIMISMTNPEHLQMSINVLDMSGRTVMSENFNAQGDTNKILNVSDLPKGVYLICIGNQHGLVARKWVR
ncbi:MAG: PKD domain-containing protein [Bacteroidia bacterium]